jgi:hypothetical protein
MDNPEKLERWAHKTKTKDIQNKKTKHRTLKRRETQTPQNHA